MPALLRLPVRLAATPVGTGSSFDDSSNSNRILAVVAILAAIGVLMLIFSYWYWRSTKPEPPALAPLELLSSRKLRSAPPEVRKRALDEVRPVATGETDQPLVPVPEPELADLAALASRDLPPLAQLQDSDPSGPAADSAGPAVPSLSIGPPAPAPSLPSPAPPVPPTAAPVPAPTVARETPEDPVLPPPAVVSPSPVVVAPGDLAEASVGDASSDVDVRPVP